ERARGGLGTEPCLVVTGRAVDELDVEPVDGVAGRGREAAEPLERRLRELLAGPAQGVLHGRLVGTLPRLLQDVAVGVAQDGGGGADHVPDHGDTRLGPWSEGGDIAQAVQRLVAPPLEIAPRGLEGLEVSVNVGQDDDGSHCGLACVVSAPWQARDNWISITPSAVGR